MKFFSLWLPVCICAVTQTLIVTIIGNIIHDPNSHHVDDVIPLPRGMIDFIQDRKQASHAMRRTILYMFHNVERNTMKEPFKSKENINKIHDAGTHGGQYELEEKGGRQIESPLSQKSSPSTGFLINIMKPKGENGIISVKDDSDIDLTAPIDNFMRPGFQSDRQPTSDTSFFDLDRDSSNDYRIVFNETKPSGDIFLESTSACSHVTGYYGYRWLRLVVKCPSHWTNETVKTGCESWNEVHYSQRYIDEITMLPVQDNLGTVYANAFCAICHNAYSIRPWTTSLKCDTLSSSKHPVPLSDIPDLSFLKDSAYKSMCHRVIVPTFPSAIESCQRHSLLPKDAYYRSNPLETLGLPSSFPVNFNVLMNFDFTGNTHILFSAGQKVVQNEYVKRCHEGETFDTYSKMCRPISCSSSHRLQGGKCVPVGDSNDGIYVDNQVNEDLPIDFDISSLSETAKVSLSVNISFGLYLIFKEENDLNAIVSEQIADNLNISIDRITHVNVSFDFGSINKTGFQVQKLSQEKYKEYFPDDDKSLDTTTSTPDVHQFHDRQEAGPGGRQKRVSSKHRSNWNFFLTDSVINNSKYQAPKYERVKSETTLTGSGSNNKNKKLFMRTKRQTGNSEKSLNEFRSSSKPFRGLETNYNASYGNTTFINFLSEISSQKIRGLHNHQKGEREDKEENNQSHRLTNKDRSKRTGHSISEIKTNDSYHKTSLPLSKTMSKSFILNKHVNSLNHTKVNQWQRIQQMSRDHIRYNMSQWDTLWSLLREGKINQSISTSRTLTKAEQNKTSVSGGENKLYVSPPLNKYNERMLVGANSDVDLDEPMAMRISFILVPPNDPASDEDEARLLLKKITDLITDNEFTLLVSGNEVSVINSDDPAEDEEMANKFCPWGVMFIVYDDEFTILEIDNVTMLYVNKTNTYHGIGRFDLWVMVKGENSANETNLTKLREYAFVCFMPRIYESDCQRIDLSPDEYQVMSENRSILFEEHEYNITTYVVLNETTGKIQICVPQSYDPDGGQLLPHFISVDSACGLEFDDVRRAEGYLTMVLGRVSIIAQALVLVTYILFPSLRNLPGCNIMNLTLALFIAETIFEEGMLVGKHWRCITVAITLHFFFLASHFWMNVMSFDVYRAFSKPNMSTNKNEMQTYFPRYFLYAWGMPAVIVGICSFIEFSDLFKNIEIGYGGTERSKNSNITITYSNFLYGDQETIDSINNNVEDIDKTNNLTFTDSVIVEDNLSACWIQNPLASLIAFGGPILLIFIANCIFFVKTIISISRTVRMTNESLRRQHSNSSNSKTTARSEAMLYLRMSTVMGFTWVFGFSSAIISSVAKPITTTICAVVHVHSILFVIFNISQGLFIFVAFVCNRRVLRLYIDLLIRLKGFIRQKSHSSKIYSVTSKSDISTKTTAFSSFND